MVPSKAQNTERNAKFCAAYCQEKKPNFALFWAKLKLKYSIQNSGYVGDGGRGRGRGGRGGRGRGRGDSSGGGDDGGGGGGDTGGGGGGSVGGGDALGGDSIVDDDLLKFLEKPYIKKRLEVCKIWHSKVDVVRSVMNFLFVGKRNEALKTPCPYCLENIVVQGVPMTVPLRHSGGVVCYLTSQERMEIVPLIMLRIHDNESLVAQWASSRNAPRDGDD